MILNVMTYPINLCVQVLPVWEMKVSFDAMTISTAFINILFVMGTLNARMNQGHQSGCTYR